jgi:hypothetical protein
LFPKELRGIEPEVSVTKGNGSLLKVRIALTSGARQFVRKFDIETKWRFPIIVGNALETYRDGQLVREKIGKAWDFQDCGDGIGFPLRMVIAEKEANEEVWSLTTWIADENGVSLPNHKDFTMKLDADEKRVGLQKEFKGQKEINILDLSFEDLYKLTKEEYELQQSSADKPQDRHSSPVLTYSVVSLCLVPF